MAIFNHELEKWCTKVFFGCTALTVFYDGSTVALVAGIVCLVLAVLLLIYTLRMCVEITPGCPCYVEPPPICFGGEGVAKLQDGTPVRIDQLVCGDTVRSGAPNGYSTIKGIWRSREGSL